VISPLGHERLLSIFAVNTHFFFRDKLPIYQHENAGVFPGKMCSERRKNRGCGQKEPESTSSAIFGVETAAKSCELKRCAERVRTEPTRQI